MKAGSSILRPKRGRRLASMLLTAMATVAVSVSTATATSPEPLALVGATFDLRSVAPPAIQVCGNYQALILQLGGTESDASATPHPELTGNLEANLRFVFPMSQSASRPGIGSFSAILRDTKSAVAYKGKATVIGTVDRHASFRGRGVLDAVLYSNGQPTVRHLLANLSIVTHSNGTSGGGLGSGSPAIPTFAAETNGQKC